MEGGGREGAGILRHLWGLPPSLEEIAQPFLFIV